jgi:RHS repeat-associated protein
MPNRKINPGSYRYGFNGQENDGEVGQGITTAEFWEYDTRIGRRWENDPVVKPHESPYAAFANNPIWFADPSGADTITFTKSSVTFKNASSNGGNTGVNRTYGSSNLSVAVRAAAGEDVFYFNTSNTTIDEDGTHTATSSQQFFPSEHSYSGITETPYFFDLLSYKDNDLLTLSKLAPTNILEYLIKKSGGCSLYRTAKAFKSDYELFSALKTGTEFAYSAYVQGQIVRGLIGTAGKVTLNASAAEIEVNEATISKALEGSTMQTLQSGVSLPAVQRYVKMLQSGSQAPAIKVSNSVIVEGNHRYIAYRILGLEVETVPSTISPSQMPNIRPIQQIKIDPADWGNH